MSLTTVFREAIILYDLANYQVFFRYSYDYGSVHFIMMSSEHDFREGSRQYKWLENDLKNVDRKKTPWVVLGGHRPMYTSQEVLSNNNS